MTPTLPARDVPSRLVRLAMTVALMIGLFAAAAIPFDTSSAPAGGPEAVAVGALGAVVVLTFAEAPLDRLATRVTRRVRSTPYDTIADVAGRLASTVPTASSAAHIAEAVARGVGADRVEIELGGEAGRVVGFGRPAVDAPEAHRTEVGGDPAPLGELRVHKAGGLTPHEVRLVDDVAASAVVALRNARAAAELEQRTAEVAATVDAIAASRRQLVIAEQRHRETMARQVTAALTPIFGRLRDEVRRSDLDAAAGTAEALIDTLRSVSSAVLSGAERR